jgi:hypothetical protein
LVHTVIGKIIPYISTLPEAIVYTSPVGALAPSRKGKASGVRLQASGSEWSCAIQYHIIKADYQLFGNRSNLPFPSSFLKPEV